MLGHERNISLEKQIDAYLRGQLSEEEVQALWIELLKQPDYIALLQTEIDLKRVYRSKSRQVPAPNTYWKWVAAAAAVAILVISVNFFSTDSQKSMQQWAQDRINLSENLSTAQVTRSSGKIAASDSMLNAGFRAAIDGKITEAMQIYKTVLAQFKSPTVRSKASLNLGILQYNGGHFKESIRNFKQAVAASPGETLLKEQAYWYMGNAYINTNELSKARDAVQQAYSLGRIYKSGAFKLLKRLDYRLGNIDFDNFEQQVNAPNK